MAQKSRTRGANFREGKAHARNISFAVRESYLLDETSALTGLAASEVVRAALEQYLAGTRRHLEATFTEAEREERWQTWCNARPRVRL